MLYKKMKSSVKKSNLRLATPVFVNHNSCDGCGICTEVCPMQLFEMKEITDKEQTELSFFGRLKVRIKGNVKSYVIDPESCIACGKCVISCHEHAITVRDYKRST